LASRDLEDRTTVPVRIRAVTSPAMGAVEALGPYRLLAELGTGGMATVYEAIDSQAPPDAPHVAVKVLHEHLAREASHVDNFLDEGRLGLRLDHPSVCRVLDVGKVGGRPYVAMELLQGAALDRLFALLARRPELARDITWTRAIVSVVAEVADGLHAAHALTDEEGRLLDVVHRDVSPENLYLLDDGSARLADFGVARHADRTHATLPGMIKGKLAYLAPEIFQGAPLDRRADVWSLGVVLWELLVGRSLFRRASEAELMSAVLQKRIVEPSQMCSCGDGALDALVMSTLARDPAHRLAGADVLRDRLRAWLVGHGGVLDADDRRAWLESHREALEALPGRISGSMALGAALLTPSSPSRPGPAPVTFSPASPAAAPDDAPSVDASPLTPSRGASLGGGIEASLRSSATPQRSTASASTLLARRPRVKLRRILVGLLVFLLAAGSAIAVRACSHPVRTVDDPAAAPPG
jgi:serine/threonine protein kinase